MSYIQKQWRCAAALDETRQERIGTRWTQIVAEMIQQNSGKSKNKRQQAFARKLQLITNETRRRVIKRYYKDNKLKHIFALHKHFSNLGAYGTVGSFFNGLGQEESGVTSVW